MGNAADIIRPDAIFNGNLNNIDLQTTSTKLASKVRTLMGSLRHNMPNDNISSDEQTKDVHIIDVINRLFDKKKQVYVECGRTVEFNIYGNDEYDIIQVYENGDEYYRVNGGYYLSNIKSSTLAKDRRMLFSLDFDESESEIALYFCVIPSSNLAAVFKTQKCPKNYCELNCVKVIKREQTIILTNEQINQKVYLQKGDTIQLEWTKDDTDYHIEEKNYCPLSGGLYNPEEISDTIKPEWSKYSTDYHIEERNRRPISSGPYTPKQTSTTTLSKEKYTYRKTFDKFGMSYLFRLTGTNQIHDITVCVINGKYKIKHIKITDNDIRPNIISIEQNDWIMFEWNTRREQTVVQIERCHIDEYKQQSNELRTAGEHFFWPNQPARVGCMYHQFKETGVYYYKTANDKIGTIIVEPETILHQVPIFNDRLIHQMDTNDCVQFNWKQTDSPEDPILIVFDSNSSVVSDPVDGRTYMFDCSRHKCSKIEPFFRHHFHTCETFLLNIPRHGLYNFAYSNNPENALISVIVENGIDTHRVNYNEEDIWKPHTIKINCFDQVKFFSSSATRASTIYQTDEYGNQLKFGKILFSVQQNNNNYFIKQFSRSGIYYFSTDIENDDKRKAKQSSKYPLAIIVLPEICFHTKIISQGNFNSQAIITSSKNDFVIWKFEKSIYHDVIKLNPNETFQSLISCHDRAIFGKQRRCLAVNCKNISYGATFFCNPDFERVTGSYKDRLISTVIIDTPFSENSFIITNKQFIPNILHIGENDTVSWILTNNEPNHRIYIQSNGNDTQDDQNILNRNIAQYADGVHHLHMFNQPGQYNIKSDGFSGRATVFVYPSTEGWGLQTKLKTAYYCGEVTVGQVQKPKIIEEIDPVSEFNTPIQLACPKHRNATIYYTLDGSLPSLRDNNVHLYDPKIGIRLREPGLQLIRAYATEDQKISSSVTISSPTFVMGNREFEPPQNSFRIRLSGSLECRNKIYGKIEIKPARSIDLIDHFQLYINDIAQETIISLKDCQFLVYGSDADEQYEIYVVAYPKDHIICAETIRSNRLILDNKSESPRPASSVNLSASNVPSTNFPIWAHIDVHVSKSTTLSAIEMNRHGMYNDDDDDFRRRAQILLRNLTERIEYSSKQFNSTYRHPHSSYPGVRHYVDNQLLSQRSSISSHDPYTGRRPRNRNDVH